MFFNFLSIVFSLIITLTFIGCESGSVDSSPKEIVPITFSGVVVDGYIKDATVCLDLNLNAVCDSSEPTTKTSSTGVFNFNDINTTQGSYISVIASGGVDTSTLKYFTGEFKSILSVDSIDTYTYLTPLTDLVATEFLNSSPSNAILLNNTKNLVSNAYTISPSYINKNPMAYDGVYARSQEVQQTIGLFEAVSIKAQNKILTSIEKKILQKDIKTALIKQIIHEGKLDVVKTATYLEKTLNITFTDYEKTYLDEQLRAIKLSIDEFRSTSNKTSADLKNYQIALEKSADTIYSAITVMDGNSTIPIVPIDIDIAQILALNETNTTLPSAEVDVTTPETTRDVISFGGYVVDGYISGASICMDLNYNGSCDSTEPSTVSDNNGSYYFTNIEVKKGTVFPVISSGGRDTTLNKLRNSQLQNIVDTASVTTLNLTPISDYIAVSFAEENNKTIETLNNVLANLSTGFALSTSDLSINPMQDVNIFILSQKLEYTRRILEKILGKTVTTSLQNTIKKEILTQVLEKGYASIALDRVITTLEIDLTLSVSSEKRSFATDQMNEISRVLDLMASSSDISNYTLPTLQLQLETSVSTAIDNLHYTDIDLTPQSVSYSEFSRSDALYDSQACLVDSTYTNTLTDSSSISNSSSSYTADPNNGLIVNSSGDVITLYYESLNQTLVGSNVTLFLENSDNYIAFDEAWVPMKKTIYIQLPKDGGNKYTCYRAHLNSVLAGGIVYEKVFRYTELP